MARRFLFAALLLVLPRAGGGQPLGVLHIRVVITDASRNATPVPNYALLISDNPSTSAPRRVVTAAGGSVDVRLRPGNYTIESDQPLTFEGRSYIWTQTLDIVAGRDAVLELTTQNAEIGAAAATAAPLETSVSSLLLRWQDSVVAVWTPTTHASGFVIDARGLIATSQRAVGGATSIEVQFTPAVKVAARVVAADPERGVAVLWVDSSLTASARPVPLGCPQSAAPAGAIKEGQEIFTIGSPLHQQKGPAFGTVTRLDTRAITADIRLPSGSAGGPVFTSDGIAIGFTAMPAEQGADGGAQDDRQARIFPIQVVCSVLASAEDTMKKVAPPDRAHLPVEPIRPVPEEALKESVKRRAGSLSPAVQSSAGFDAAFITPIQIVAAREGALAQRLLDFSNWSEYVADTPPVLLVRVTPKLAEGFWTSVARGAAATQGAALPPMKRPKSRFVRMQAFCGDSEVTPIHSFTIQQRVSRSDVLEEGLYVFEPDALSPRCSAVKLVIFSDKDVDKGETLVVDPKVSERVRQDFALYQ